jgi:hypothetical protein
MFLDIVHCPLLDKAGRWMMPRNIIFVNIVIRIVASSGPATTSVVGDYLRLIKRRVIELLYYET